VKILSQEYPTIAFHASINHSFGKGSLIQLLRQFAKLHSDKKQISVGFIGYPNTGKSSIINTLRNKKVCNVAPIPGETKVWQYITLMRRIYLIDCPGVVQPASSDSETEIILKGVVRIESVKQPEDHIPTVLERLRKEYIRRTYGVQKWTDHIDFLTQLAKKTGKLNKGAEADLHTVAKMVLNDWLRGKLPYYVMPPDSENFTAPPAESRVPGVEQRLHKIKTDTEFVPEDLKPTGEQEVEAEDQEKAEVDADAASELDWDDVFEEVADEGVSEGNTDSSMAGETLVESESLHDDMDSDFDMSSDTEPARTESSNDDQDVKPGKKNRMTTNKKKIGTHYYKTANVKNKNRSKTAKNVLSKRTDPRQLERRLKGDGKRRN
jgi:nuclear GTP-binding protein